MNLRIPFLAIAASLAACMGISSCGDDGTIGSSLLEDQVQIVVDSNFTVTGRSVAVPSVRPRTLTELIGAIDIPAYGTMRSSVVAQFLPAVYLDTANYTAANMDSVFMNFRYTPGSFIGDSVAPMGITVYPLTRALPQNLTSDFDPTGYYDPNKVLGTKVYTASTLDDSEGATLATRTVAVRLPLEFGRKLFEAFEANPADFASGAAFTANVFPGVYIESSFGSGRLLQVARTSITWHMSKITYNTTTEKNDTVKAEQECFTVAPEVLNNNNITVDYSPAMLEKINSGSTMLVAPAGYEAEIRLPVPELIASYKASGARLTVLNSVTLNIPADTIASNGEVTPPPYVLLVLKKERDEFFAQSKLPDNKTSFYATYASSGYTFSGLNTYLNELMDSDEELKEEDYTFSIVPVAVEFERDANSYYSTSYIVSSVLPYIQAPVAAELNLAKAKVKLTYSKQVNL